MNGCGCNYWKELIKSAWGLATTSVRAVKTKDETKYPNGDGLIDLSDIAGGGEGTVTSVNGKQPDAQGNVVVGSGDIATPDGTVQGDIEDLGANLASEISARASGDEALQSAVDGKQDALTSAQQAAVDSGITKDKVTSFSMTTQNLTRLSNRVDILEGDITTAEGNIETLGTQIGTVDTRVDGKQDKLTAGANVQITGNTISATDTKYTLPTASSTVLGGVKVGTGLTITDGVLNATGTTAGVSSVNGKTGAVTIGASDVLSTAQLNAANSGITTSKVSTYDGYSTSKQDKLSTAQLNAANSGITASKVTTYDGYATTIAGKQDKLTPGSNITISGNTISATDTKYTLPTASASVLGGVKVGSGLSISNGVLSATGGGGGGNLHISAINWDDLRDYLAESYNTTSSDAIHALAVLTVIEPNLLKIDIDGSFPTWNTSITNVKFGGSTNLSSYRFCGIAQTNNSRTLYLNYTISAGSSIKYDYTLHIPITPVTWDLANDKGIMCEVTAYNAVEIKSLVQYFSPSAFNFYKITS